MASKKIKKLPNVKDKARKMPRMEHKVLTKEEKKKLKKKATELAQSKLKEEVK